MWERMMACDTELRAVDHNISEDLVSNCAIFMVDILLLNMVLQRFFSTLFGVITSATLGDTTKYVLMVFTVLLLLTISSNTGASS